MKHLLLIFLSFLCPISSFAKDDMGITNNQAKSVVRDFYNALKSLPNVRVDDFYAYRDKNIYPLIISSDAFRHPNDIQPLVNQVGVENNWKYINAYIGIIREYSRDKGFSMDFDVCDDIIEVEYENQKNHSIKSYWEVIVNKTFNIDGKEYFLIDTVTVNANNGKIVFISNSTYKEDVHPLRRTKSFKPIED